MKQSNIITIFGLLATIGLSLVQTTLIAAQRPINDFLSRQGRWSLHVDGNGFVDCAASTYDGGLSGIVFDPPIQNFANLTDPQNSTSNTRRFVRRSVGASATV